MGGLLYRDDMDEARERLTRWWNGDDIGRPVLLVTAPRETPLEAVPAMTEPEGWVTHYSTSNLEYRVYLARRACVNTYYLAEAVPTVGSDLAPNTLALYLGCRGLERPGTVWCEPFIRNADFVPFQFDPNNVYWQFTLRLARELLGVGEGKWLVQIPDLIEGLDTLAAMRGTELLLVDLVERPDWVHHCLRCITELYFGYYDILYELFRDETGGSVFWMWAPGRMAKFQCDFSAMISPTFFQEFMVPVLREMTRRVDYCMYHWDGPGALRHHDLLLAIPRITMIQWTPGEGNEPPTHPRWWPYYHKTIEAGKKVYIAHGCSVADLEVLKKEFGPKFHQFALHIHADSLQQANAAIRAASNI